MGWQEITDIEDEMNGNIRIAFDDNEPSHRASKWVTLSCRDVDRFGLNTVLKECLGIKPDTRLLPVYQSGEIVGQLPAYFDPKRVKSSTFLYQARAGDFRREGDKWIADSMLGLGDLKAAGVRLTGPYTEADIVAVKRPGE